MRQGQQNRRGRGRNNNNNRKHQNPLTRTFESSGPDVKIRGTPAHVAEKYVTLARDALSSGDPVLAENYLQHAEHYNRIIMSYREQQAQQQAEQPRTRHDTDQPASAVEGGEDIEAPSNASGTNGAHHPANGVDGDEAPQRVEAASGDDETAAGERPRRQPRSRNQRGRRPRAERSGAADENGDEQTDQPDFLTRPIKRSRRSETTEDAAPQAEPDSTPADQAAE